MNKRIAVTIMHLRAENARLREALRRIESRADIQPDDDLYRELAHIKSDARAALATKE